jgi:hypothetical protein
MQTTSNLLMIRPVDFKFNVQTAENNKFQQSSAQQGVQDLALQEFDHFVEILRKNEVNVTVINDTLKPETPDSIFPNNWVSFHDDGNVFLYPMFSENRRAERRDDILKKLESEFKIKQIIDLSFFEKEHKFLEGTGSLVLDRENKIAYACLSLRTDKRVIKDFCANTGYTAVTFNAVDESNFPIYHTNVMMCIGDKFAVICSESIPDEKEREKVLQSFKKTKKEVIEITFKQMNRFAGNMLQITNTQNESLLIMSEQAYLSLKKEQIDTLQQYCKIVYAPLYTIEKNGGGSARCMLAEVHLQKLD